MTPPNNSPLIARIRRRLASPRVLVVLPLLALVLGLPSLAGGLALDDLLLREHLADEAREVTALFDFGGPAEVAERRASGAFPWWTADDLQVRLFRPLTAATMAVEPEAPWSMHLQSVLWYALLVALVGAAYRTLARGEEVWIAGLALLLFAVDDAHAASVGWIAARHGVIGAVFGVLALLAHHRWRAHGSIVGAVAGPAALALGLLASESALACLGYVVAYAIVLDRGGARARSLIPYALVVAVWYAVYRALGHGAEGCGMYVDPAADPLGFAVAGMMQVPLLLMAQLGLPAVVELLVFVPGALVPAAALAWVGLLVCAWLVRPVLRRSAVARFWALGMILAALPLAGALPADRYLLLVGVGACGLVAATIGALCEEVRASRAIKLIAWIWIVLHVVLAALLIVPRMLGPAMMQRTIAAAARAIPSDSESRPVVLVQAPGDVFTLYAPAIRGAGGVHVLYAGVGELELERRDDASVVLRPAGGWLAAPGDRIFRGGRPMNGGEAIALPGFVVTVLEVSSDGRPAAVLVRADSSLDALRWMAWTDGVPTPLALPRVGESTTLAPASWRFD